jgi:hypothetical protein
METLPGRCLAVGLFTLIACGTNFSQAAPGAWLTVDRDNLCVTEGAIQKASGERLRVDVPKMRSYATVATAQSAEVRFTYSGPTVKESRLGSGEMRRQFGLKLRAQDACNLVYAIWRIEPESKLVVSVKRNPGAHSSAECGNRGYQNIKPNKASAVPRLTPGQSHTLRAEMKRDELRVFVDNHEVWEGSVGADAATLAGPVGIRSDNAQLEFDLKARKPEGTTGPGKPCKAGDSD